MLYILRYIAIFFLGSFVLFPSFAFAQNTEMDRQTRAFAGERGAGFSPRQSDPREVAARVIKALLGVVGTLFLAYTVYAGYLILASAGDEDKVNKGKSTLRTAIIGVLVTVSAYSLTALISAALLATQDDDESGGSIRWNVNDTGDRQYRQRNDPYASPVAGPNQELLDIRF